MVDLVRFEERHLPGMEGLLVDPGVHRFTRVPVPVPAGFARSWFERYEHGRTTGVRELFALEDAGEFVGLGMSPDIDQIELTAELGYIVAPAARGRGVGAAALAALTEWGFGALGMLRLQLYISVENTASQRVAEKCGYVLEGVLRSLFFKQGRREDFQMWSRLPSDPAPRSD